MSILAEIIENKTIEIAKAKSELTINKMKTSHQALGFVKSLLKAKQPRVIGEVKKASPSKGVILEDFDPLEIAKRHSSSGAQALSVLTDEKYFQGKLSYLGLIKSALPNVALLRKDFIIDQYQIHEAKYYQADAILLIASALTKPQMQTLQSQAIELGLDTIIEVHNEQELETVLELSDLYPDKTLIGINNRNLKTFTVDLDNSLKLIAKYQNKTSLKFISESGISTKQDAIRLIEAGFSALLIGENIVKNPNLLGEISNAI